MNLKHSSVFAIALLGPLGISLPIHAQQKTPSNPPPASVQAPVILNSPAGSTSSAGFDAVNGLIALPWPGVVDQELKPFRQQLTHMSSGQNFMDATGSGWEFTMAFSSLELTTNADTLPPGFVPSTGGFSVRAPLNGSWTFNISGNLLAHASASTDLTLVRGISTGKRDLLDQGVTVPFSLGINGVSAAASSTLDTSDPARPKLVSGNVQVTATLEGSVLFPEVPVNIDFTRQPDGSLAGQISLTQGLGIRDFVEVDEGLQLSINILPFSSNDTWVITLALGGVLYVDFPSPIGRVAVPSQPFFTLPLVIPVKQLFGHKADSAVAGFGMARGPIPIPWPPANSVMPTSGAAQEAPPASVDLVAPLDTIEAGIVATHMPYNAVLSIQYPQPGTVAAPAIGDYTYAIDADSTIWTGHYLAAESFRYAATPGPAALARVQAAIQGLQTDFSVTTDAVLENNQYTSVEAAVKLPNAPNVPQNETDEAGFIFARSTILFANASGTATLPVPGASSGPTFHDWAGTHSVAARIKAGVCLYVKPSGGWTITKKGVGDTKVTANYPTYAAAVAALGSGAGRLTPVDTAEKPISYGSACGNRGDTDNVVSRDQYSGVFMGLAYAYVLVPPVQAQVRSIIDGALDYVLLNKWNVPLPPDRTIITSFIGGFDAQLFLLRIGATVDPTHVPTGTNESYQQLYARYSPASAFCWIPDWFSTADPLNGYYKYNLSHSYLGVLLFLETDPTLRGNYLKAYNIMRAATADHRNAYFNLVDILVKAASTTSPSPSNPSISLQQETTSDLADFVTRWNAVKGSNGMPTNATSQSAATYLTSLWPNYIKTYTNMSLDQNWTVTFPLPLQFRTGAGMEFVWQMPPNTAGIDSPTSNRQVKPTGFGTQPTYICNTTPPTADQVIACSTEGNIEGPGVDFLLPYWLGVYLNVW